MPRSGALVGWEQGALGGRLLKDKADPSDADLVAGAKKDLLDPLSVDPSPVSTVEVPEDQCLGGPLNDRMEPGDFLVRQMEGVGRMSAQGKGCCYLVSRTLEEARPSCEMRCRQ